MGNEETKKVVNCMAPPVLLRYEAEVNGVRQTVWAGQSIARGWDRHVRANCLSGNRVFPSIEQNAIEDIVKAFSRFTSSMPLDKYKNEELDFQNLDETASLLRRIMRVDPRAPSEQSTLGNEETVKSYDEIAVRPEDSPDIWGCKIGEIDRARLPLGADLPMRRAVRDAYYVLTGEEPRFIFSGWGESLTEGERDAVLGTETGTTRREAVGATVASEVLDDRTEPGNPDEAIIATTREALPIPTLTLRVTVSSISKEGEDEGGFFLHANDNGDELADGWSIDIAGTMRAGFESSEFLRSLVKELVIAYNDAAYRFDAPLVGLDRAVKMSLAKMVRDRDATAIGGKQKAEAYAKVFGGKPNIQTDAGSSPSIFSIAEGGTSFEFHPLEEFAKAVEILVGGQTDEEPAIAVAAGDDSNVEKYESEVRESIEPSDEEYIPKEEPKGPIAYDPEQQGHHYPRPGLCVHVRLAGPPGCGKSHTREKIESLFEQRKKALPEVPFSVFYSEGNEGLRESVPADSARDVLAERRRQIDEEGWTAEHDDVHVRYELALAAVSYAIPFPVLQPGRGSQSPDVPLFWPNSWAPEWYKPGKIYNARDRRRRLVKAAALLLAEIDRVDRQRERESKD